MPCVHDTMGLPSCSATVRIQSPPSKCRPLSKHKSACLTSCVALGVTVKVCGSAPGPRIEIDFPTIADDLLSEICDLRGGTDDATRRLIGLGLSPRSRGQAEDQQASGKQQPETSADVARARSLRQCSYTRWNERSIGDMRL